MKSTQNITWLVVLASVVLLVVFVFSLLLHKDKLNTIEKRKNTPETSNEKTFKNTANDTLESGIRNPKKIFHSSHSVKNDIKNPALAGYQQHLEKLINDFPFLKDDTRSILSMNTPEVQLALQQLDEKIRSEILNNENLTHAEKTQLVWDKFINTHWVGEDNAVAALLKDYLTSLPAYEAYDEIIFQLETLKQGNEELLHQRNYMLQMASAILMPALVDVDSLNPEEQSIYQSSQKSIKNFLKTEIHKTKNFDSPVVAEDTIFSATDAYFQTKNTSEITEITNEIIDVVESSPNIDSSNDYYQILIHHIFSQPDVSQQAMAVLLERSTNLKTKEQLSEAIIVQLADDTHVLNIPEDMRVRLINYLYSHDINYSNQNPENELYQKAIKRLEGI